MTILGYHRLLRSLGRRMPAGLPAVLGESFDALGAQTIRSSRVPQVNSVCSSTDIGSG